MEGQAIVVSTGRNCSFSTMASAMCCCSFQSQLSSRAPSPERLLAKMQNDGTSDWAIGQGICLQDCEKDGRRRKLKKDFRFSTERRVSAYGKAYDVLHRRDGLSADPEIARASADRRSEGAHPLREESGEQYWSYRNGSGRDGHDGDALSGKGGAVMYFPNDYTWQGSSRPGMTRVAGDGGFFFSEVRDRTPGRFLDGRNVQCLPEDAEGVFQESMLGRRAGILKGSADQENGSGQESMERESTSNIPISELMKIEELMFSGDLHEGDSGAQVLNLQRALFWLGHLRGLSLTGYFGPETVRAVQEFHASHGIHNRGVWGAQSQQVLWNRLHPESDRQNPAEEVSEKSRMEHKKIRESALADTWLLLKNMSGKVVEEGLHASQALRQWSGSGLTEFVSSVSSLPHLTVAPGSAGVMLSSFVALSSIAALLHFFSARVHGQPVKRRVMSWRGDIDLRQRSRKATQTPLDVLQDPLKATEGESLARYFQNRICQKCTPNQEDNVLDRLVLFDGQVLRGDYPRNGKILPHASTERGDSSLKSLDDVSHSTRTAKSVPILSLERLDQSESELDSQRKDYGYDRPGKLQVDPPRKISSHNWSPMQNGNSPRLTGGEQLWSANNNLHDVSHPGWAAWLGHFLATFFPNKERHPPLPCRIGKSSSRRAVVRSNSHMQSKPSGNGVSNLGSSLTSGKPERDIITDHEAKWQLEDELNLKKQIEDLHRTVKSVEQTRAAAMRALAEEKMRSLELEVKIRHQKEAAASLEEEVRVLKDSHEALLASLRKKYSSSAAARAAAALLYQNWDPSDASARV